MDGSLPAAPDTPGLAVFVQTLAAEGRAVVRAGPLPRDDAPARAALEQLDSLARAELGLDVPPLSPDAALWAARLFYHLCQFTVCRDLGEAQIKEACSIPCPAPRNANTAWSVDLTLRHLPRLFALAKHLSPTDPLILQLKRVAAAWPLSSVGIPGLEPLEPDSILDHPALRRLYADRILARGDVSRLGDSRVDDGLRSDLGLHRDLARALSARLHPNHDPH